MVIKAIIFDIGGVLLKIDNFKVCSKLARFCDFSTHEIFNIVYEAEDLELLERGDITFRDFFRRISIKLSLRMNFKDFKEIFQDNETGINKDVVDVLVEAKGKYRTLLLSNNNEIHFAYHSKKYHRILSLADKQLISYKIGMRKPELQIFKKAIKEAKAKPEEIIYIDDLKENTKAARKMGIIGIHYTKNTKLREIMKENKVFL